MQNNFPNREWWIVNQFTRRATHFINAAPEERNYLEWLALIQHHGGPTRLLDFSHSFYTAAFFAIETAGSDAAVWAINSAKLEDSLMDVLQKSKKDLSRDDAVRIPRETVNQLVGKKAQKQFVFAVEPHRTNERLAAQQGLFAFPTDITTSFQANLAASYSQSPEVFANRDVKEISSPKDLQMNSLCGVAIKLILPRSAHKEAIDDLKSMNVTAASLFPGLDGFARSLHYHLSLFQGNPEFYERMMGA